MFGRKMRSAAGTAVACFGLVVLIVQPAEAIVK